MDQAQTAVERGRARLLAGRIARFDDIKQRQDSVLAMRSETDRTNRLLTGLQPKDAGDGHVRAAKFEVDGRFDGIGQLTQVVSPKVVRRVMPWWTNRATCAITSRRRRA